LEVIVIVSSYYCLHVGIIMQTKKYYENRTHLN
jgi:hypothetical protein